MRWLARLSIGLAIAVAACGHDGGEDTNRSTAGNDQAQTRAYVAATTADFDSLVEARRGWEDATGRRAIREATRGVLASEQDMLDRLRATDPPTEMRARHERMIAVLTHLTAELGRRLAARRLDTDAVDTAVGRTIEVENVVTELYRFG
jgi:hypothetical protein